MITAVATKKVDESENTLTQSDTTTVIIEEGYPDLDSALLPSREGHSAMHEIHNNDVEHAAGTHAPESTEDAEVTSIPGRVVAFFARYVTKENMLIAANLAGQAAAVGSFIGLLLA